MAFTLRARGNPVLHSDPNQYGEYLSGTSTQEVLRVGNSTSSYADTVVQRDTTNGYIARWGYGAAGSETYVLALTKNGISLDQPITVSGSATLAGLRRWQINVKDYGVTGDGSTDDTAAINTIMNLLRTYTQAPGFGCQIYWPQGRYCVSTINAYAIDNMEWIGDPGGVMIHGNKQVSSGKPVVDAIDCGNFTVRGVSVAGANTDGSSPSIVPTVGWLIARSTTGALSNAIYFDRVDGYGSFQVCQVFMSNTVDIVFQMCRPALTNTLKRSFVITNDPSSYSVTSPNRTIYTSADVTANITFVGVGAQGVEINGATNVNFFGGSIDGNSGVAGPTSDYCVNIKGTNDKLGFYNTQFTAGIALSTGVFNLAAGTLSGLTIHNGFFNAVLSNSVPLIKGVDGTIIQGLNITGMTTNDLNGATPKILDIADNSTASTNVVLGGHIDCAGMAVDHGGSMRGVTIVRPNAITLPVGADMPGCLIIDPQSTVPSSSAIVVGQNNAIRAGDGSVGNPTFGWTADTDNGFYRATTNTPAAVAAGAEVFRWSSAGLAMQNNQPFLPAAVSGTPVSNALYTNNLVKGYAKFTMSGGVASNPTITAGFNADSTVTRTGTGDYTVSWTTDLPTANHMVWAMSGDGLSVGITSQAAGSVRFQVRDLANNPADTGTVWVAVLGL